MAESLRARLRVETRAAHDAVDAAVADLDLRRADDLRAMLRGQAAAFGAMGGAGLGDLDEGLRDLRADLAALGAEMPAPMAPPAVDHPLARRYLWLGSRLGARMMAKAHRGADPRAARAGRWLARPAPQGAWPALVEDLSARPATGAEADRIVAAALAWFALFEAAALREVAHA
ncbi:hypothetical protein JQC91_06940 [Jannaschia sp. Os4]|uniref:hypothetical protein n=1 Tax=Jannaschia sp. Os4 TaxID=2807617 RepID=UPI001939D13B|nr:hypothetical protein [Jannaschia sp. Os4]MBM2576035.1 hypothetical protein [Jannaschia sp. Os4]